MQGQGSTKGPRDHTKNLQQLFKLLEWQWSVALELNSNPVLREDVILPFLRATCPEADGGMIEGLLTGHPTWKFNVDPGNGLHVFWRDEGPSQQQPAATSTIPQPTPTTWEVGQNGVTGPGNEWNTAPTAHYGYEHQYIAPMAGEPTFLPLQNQGGMPWSGGPSQGFQGGMTPGGVLPGPGGKAAPGIPMATGTSMGQEVQHGAPAYGAAPPPAMKPNTGGPWQPGPTTNTLPIGCSSFWMGLAAIVSCSFSRMAIWKPMTFVPIIFLVLSLTILK